MSCFNRDTSPRDLSIMTLLSMLRIWIKVWIRNYFFTFKIDMNFQVGIRKLLFKAIKVWELNSWLLWYFGQSEAIEITVIGYLDWIDIFCFCFRIPWYELGDYPNWAILYLYDIGLPFFGVSAIAMKIMKQNGKNLKREVQGTRCQSPA